MANTDKPLCACGVCHQPTAGGQFLPGHDQTLRTALEGVVGGLLPLRALVEANSAYAAGMIDTEKFTMTVRQIFANRPR
jgi:hypothetical protein